MVVVRGANVLVEVIGIIVQQPHLNRHRRSLIKVTTKRLIPRPRNILYVCRDDG